MQYLFCFLLLARTLIVGQTTISSSGEDERSLRLKIAAQQLALENDGFSPGVIDGCCGPKTLQALEFAHQAGRTNGSIEQPWISWKIPPRFLSDVIPLPNSWEDRSKLTKLNYETLLEKIAERFHVSENFLSFLNAKLLKKVTEFNEGDFLDVPYLSLRRLPPASYLQIYLKKKVIVAYGNDDQILASFPCSIAARKEKRPLGKLGISVKVLNPDYLFDPALFKEIPEAATMKSKLIIPPGPNNPVGEMWIGLNSKGYGIHGTPRPEEIGKSESHGCFRLSNWDAKRLADIVRIGTPVFVME